ncbi:hypothetical protein BJX70DRAFT_358421 [Aspergillus crustosus]
MPRTVQTIISEELTQYIRIEALQFKLLLLFGQTIEVRYHNGRYIFDAPGSVSLSEIE